MVSDTMSIDMKVSFVFLIHVEVKSGISFVISHTKVQHLSINRNGMKQDNLYTRVPYIRVHLTLKCSLHSGGTVTFQERAVHAFF